MSATRPRLRALLGELQRVAFLLAFGFFCLLIGFLTTIAHVFPYSFFRSALIELGGPGSVSLYQSEMYVPADSSKVGVARYDPERAYNGYTLFTSAHTQGAFLIDMKGRVLHSWALPYSRVWNHHAAVKHPVAHFVTWDKAYLYPNGDLLAVYVRWGTALYGYGLVKMDQYSHPQWAYLQHVHHDVTVGPDGRIYTLTQRIRRRSIPGVPFDPPANDNSVVVLSPYGKVLNEVSVLDAFARSKYRGMLALDRDADSADPLHINSVNPMPASFHRIFPFAGPNTVLISSRTLDTIALLDLDSRKIIWLQHGPFARQHDAEFLSNGDMMLFDDVGDTAYGRRSRVIEFQPNPFKIVWQFPGDTGHKLNSQILGSVQKLPNGNVLITDGDQGRILEVTPDKKIVWEYNNPFRQGDKKQYVPIIRWAHRFAPAQLHFKLGDQEVRGSNS
jgi:Arylsulfotransferase (ASST)